MRPTLSSRSFFACMKIKETKQKCMNLFKHQIIYCSDKNKEDYPPNQIICSLKSVDGVSTFGSFVAPSKSMRVPQMHS